MASVLAPVGSYVSRSLMAEFPAMSGWIAKQRRPSRHRRRSGLTLRPGSRRTLAADASRWPKTKAARVPIGVKEASAAMSSLSINANGRSTERGSRFRWWRRGNFPHVSLFVFSWVLSFANSSRSNNACENGGRRSMGDSGEALAFRTIEQASTSFATPC
jgi:hypothetical protein